MASLLKKGKIFQSGSYFKIKAGLSPLYLSQSFTQVSDVHRYNLRQSGLNFSLARCSSPTGTFNREAISGWNSLPADLKAIRSLPLFKTRMKMHLMSS